MLKGVKVVEMLGLAPGPFCGTILADFGASVTVVQKMGKLTTCGQSPQKKIELITPCMRTPIQDGFLRWSSKIQSSPFDVMSNGKRMISVDLKSKEGINIVRKLCSVSDVLLDTFRPGVMEKIGLGPEILMADNEKLIYARLTGYGQTGPFKNKAGHDINYVAMSGVLSMLGKPGKTPSPPINLLADFAGGSVLCTLGIVLALFDRTRTGQGQLVDASMTEGASYVASWLFKSRKLPIWAGEPGTNALDGGLPYYCTYKTKDNKYMAVGALEPQFYSNFLKGLQLSEEDYAQGTDVEFSKKMFTKTFLTKTQQDWCDIFKNLDACVTPVLDFQSVGEHECHKIRSSFYTDSDNTYVPNPAPRFSRSALLSVGYTPASKPGQHTFQILQELGYSKSDIEKLEQKGNVYINKKSNL